MYSANKNLGIFLKFGYTHNFQEKNCSKNSSNKKSKISSKASLKSPVQTVKLSFQNNEKGWNRNKNMKYKILTPSRPVDKKRALSINTHINL